MKKQKNVLLMLLATALLTACQSQEDGNQSGKYSLYLTDAPTYKFSKVEITITGVTVKPADGEALEFPFEEPIKQDLLQLQGGGSIALLENEKISAGRYEWVRLSLDLDQSFVYDNTGGQKTLFVPSAANSGLKLVRGFTIGDGGDHQFTVDFDVSKSIVEPTGNQADYFLKPVLRLVDNQNVGRLTGRVDASTVIQEQCADSSTYSGMVYLFEGEGVTPDDLGSEAEPLIVAPVKYDLDSEEYRYKAAFLEAGQYTIAYTCSGDDNEVDESLNFYGASNTSVVAGNDTKVDFE